MVEGGGKPEDGDEGLPLDADTDPHATSEDEPTVRAETNAIDGAADEQGAAPDSGTAVVEEAPFKQVERPSFFSPQGLEPSMPSAPNGEPASVEGLGPAFPEEGGPRGTRPIAQVIGSFEISEESTAPPKPNEVPTAAKPGAAAIAAGDALPSARAGATPSASDGWGDFDEKSGWSSVTGQKELKRAGAERKAPEPEPAPPEYSRRDTDIYKLGAKKRASEGARLVCLRGKDEGREFPVAGSDIVIGRDPKNGIVLGDGSVSREHARLLFDGERYTIVDNRSANGTFVNGERTSRARVRSGDEVGIGSALFRFLEIGDVFKPIDASGAPVLPGARASLWAQLRARPHFKTTVMSAGVVAAALLAAVLMLALGGDDRDELFAHYTKGVEAFKRRQWSEAETDFAAVIGSDPTHERSQRYLRAVQLEKSAEMEIERARAAQKAGDTRLAYGVAGGIVDSLYSAEARQMVAAIDAELDAKVAGARRALVAGSAAEAIPALEAVLLVRAGDAEAASLLARAKHALLPAPRPESAAPATAAPRPRAEPQAAAAEDEPEEVGEDEEEPRPKKSRDAPPKKSGEPVTDRAVDLFASGKIDEALRTLDGQNGREAQALDAKIKKFRKVYSAAQDEHRAKNTAEAIQLLKQAKGYESKITGGKSAVAEEIGRKLADMHYVDGIQAYLGGRYPEAYREFKQALAAFKEHRPSQRKLEDLAEKAQEIYEEGYVAGGNGETETARQRYKTVLQILPSDHQTYRKAKQRLDALPK